MLYKVRSKAGGEIMKEVRFSDTDMAKENKQSIEWYEDIFHHQNYTSWLDGLIIEDGKIVGYVEK